MNHQQIAAEIKKTEEQLAQLRAKLNEPEIPTLESSKPGDKLENGCVVVHKFPDVRMALIAAPFSHLWFWDKEFKVVFDALEKFGFNKSQWFIPNVEQLMMAYKNCKEHFLDEFYWSSTEASSATSCSVSFNSGRQYTTTNKTNTFCVRAFSLVAY